MNQILFGAALPFLVGAVIYAARKGRASLRMLILLPCIMTISILWAIAPDLPRLFGMQELYNRLIFDPRCDIFYWHYTIDKMESDSPYFLAGFVILILLLLAMAWRELYLTEKEA